MSKNKNVMAEMMCFVLSVILMAGCANGITEAYADDNLTAGVVDEEVLSAEEELEIAKNDFKTEIENALPCLGEEEKASLEDILLLIEDSDSWKLDQLKEEAKPFLEQAALVQSLRSNYYQDVKKTYQKWLKYLSADNRTKSKSKLAEINSSLETDEAWYEKKADAAKTFIEKKGQAVKKLRADAKKKAKKSYKKYKKYLSPTQQKRAVNKMNKIDKKYLKKDINSIVKYVQKIANKGKAIKKARAKAIKNINNSYSTHRILFNQSDINYIKNLKNKVNHSFSLNAIKTYQAKANQKILDLRYIPTVNTTGWSVDKINYVKIWGWKNNRFLAGTPMAGLGYIIARGAYDYNVDPAALSAIARIESGCGRYPYHSPYNAYGWVWGTPAMYSWEDGINKWYAYFSRWFSGDIPLRSMHGYGGYGVGSISGYLSAIRNA